MIKLLLLLLLGVSHGQRVITDGETRIPTSEIISKTTETLALSGQAALSAGTHWFCFDKKTQKVDNCGTCLRDWGCDGTEPFRAAYPGHRTHSPCYCTLVNDVPVVQTTIIDTQGRKYVLNNAWTEGSPDRPQHTDPTIDCSVGDATEIEEIICKYQNNATWADENEDLIVEMTNNYYHRGQSPFVISNIDRDEGVVYFAANGVYNHHYQIMYTLQLNASSSSIEYVHYGNSTAAAFPVPDQLYFRTAPLRWTTQTTSQYPFGADRPIQEGVLEWYPSRVSTVDATCDACLVCLDRPSCLKRTTRIGMAFAIIAILLILVYIPRLIWNVAKGNRSCKRMSCKKVMNFLICGLPVFADARCTNTHISQASQVSLVDGVKTVGFTGQVNLINVGDTACFNIMDSEDPIAQMVIRLKGVRAVYPTEFEYWTYSLKNGVPKVKYDSTCPVVTCGLIHCDGRCDNDRRCNGAFDSDEVTARDLDYAGLSQCSQVGLGIISGLLDDGCFSGVCPFCCSDMQRILSYTLEPETFYKVMKIDTNPQLLGTIEVSITETKDISTTTTVEYTVDLANPNGDTPFTVIEGTEFYNNGISTTFVGLPRTHVMMAEKKGESWLVDASVAPLKEVSKVGGIQCDKDKKNCDFNHALCTIVQTNSEQRVTCADDQVATLANGHESKLPKTISGRGYSMDGDALSVSLKTAGSVPIITSGTLSFIPTIATLEPECRLVTEPVGCYDCSAGFIFEIGISAENSGTVSLSIEPIDTALAPGSYGLFSNILLIPGEGKEEIFHINGFTSKPVNKYKVTASSRTHSCSVTLDWVSSLDDRTRNSTHVMDSVNPTTSIEFGSVGDFFSSIPGAIGGFFSNIFDFFGSILPGLQYVAIVIFVLVGLCLVVPCVMPLISCCKLYKFGKSSSYQLVKNETPLTK